MTNIQISTAIEDPFGNKQRKLKKAKFQNIAPQQFQNNLRQTLSFPVAAKINRLQQFQAATTPKIPKKSLRNNPKPLRLPGRGSHPLSAPSPTRTSKTNTNYLWLVINKIIIADVMNNVHEIDQHRTRCTKFCQKL
jgi:hypothetical protein